MIGLMFTLPSSTDMLQGIGQTANPVFQDFLPLIYLVGGIIVAIGLSILVVSLLSGSFHKAEK